MEKFSNVNNLVNTLKPVNPVYCIRPDTIKNSIKVFKEKSKSLNTTVHIPEKNRSYETDLKGKFQNKNIAGVVKVISLLEK